MTIEQSEPGDRFASARSFPTALPAPGTGGGSELGEAVRLYGQPAGPWPAPATAPAGVPPVVASGPGDRVGWLMRARRGEGAGDAAGDRPALSANDRLCATRW